MYLDANILIAVVERGNAEGARLRRLFSRPSADRGLELFTSEVAIAECLVAPLRDERANVVRDYLALRRSRSMATMPLNWATLEEAARLRARASSLKLPDAIHLGSALVHGCDVLLTKIVRSFGEAMRGWVAST